MMAPGIEKAEFDPRLPKMQINLIECIQEAASERDQIELEHKARVAELDLIKKNSNQESDDESRINLASV